jgi:hypothetical protein
VVRAPAGALAVQSHAFRFCQSCLHYLFFPYFTGLNSAPVVVRAPAGALAAFPITHRRWEFIFLRPSVGELCCESFTNTRFACFHMYFCVYVCVCSLFDNALTMGIHLSKTIRWRCK